MYSKYTQITREVWDYLVAIDFHVTKPRKNIATGIPTTKEDLFKRYENKMIQITKSLDYWFLENVQKNMGTLEELKEFLVDLGAGTEILKIKADNTATEIKLFEALESLQELNLSKVGTKNTQSGIYRAGSQYIPLAKGETFPPAKGQNQNYWTLVTKL